MKLIISVNNVLLLSIASIAVVNVALASAATPTVEQALNLTPVQAGVDYDRPSPQDIPKCKIVAKKINGQVGWVVEGPDGTTLRKFVDTNGDNVVDQWSYYKDGVEVYRDIDSNFNGRADQHRWFNTGGTRWGLDPKEDGTIESWKVISPEEVTAEIVSALAARDADRFARVTLTPEELKNLGLGKSRSAELAEKIGKLGGEFKQFAARQKTVTAQSAWVQFTAGKPGIVPAGTDDSNKDIRVYENVVAIVETAGEKQPTAHRHPGASGRWMAGHRLAPGNCRRPGRFCAGGLLFPALDRPPRRLVRLRCRRKQPKTNGRPGKTRQGRRRRDHAGRARAIYYSTGRVCWNKSPPDRPMPKNGPCGCDN